MIEKTIVAYLKENGFSRCGKVFYRVFEDDIFQIIEFQKSRKQDVMWVNLGIRVPECVEHKFSDLPKIKRYYHDYECNIRCRLSELSHSDTDGFSLTSDRENTAVEIIEKLQKYAMPIFDKLTNRDNILLYRRDYPDFDTMNDHLILLEEAMIYARRGDNQKAVSLLNEYKNSISKPAHLEYIEKLGDTLFGF